MDRKLLASEDAPKCKISYRNNGISMLQLQLGIREKNLINRNINDCLYYVFRGRYVNIYFMVNQY